MKRHIVVADCSVTGAWFLPEDASAAAARLLAAVLAGTVEMAEPMLWYYESLNLIRSAVVRRRLTAAAARQAAALWREVPVTWYAPRPEDGNTLLDGALAQNLSVYDATYAALARVLKCPLPTEDRALLETHVPGRTAVRCGAWQP